MNYLNAVFWDYPEFRDKKYLKRFLKKNKNKDVNLWLLQRFIEHGRVIDTLEYFSLDEINAKLNKLKINSYARRKWDRIIKVYAQDIRK